MESLSVSRRSLAAADIAASHWTAYPRAPPTATSSALRVPTASTSASWASKQSCSVIVP